jgi:hypothetical protein
MKKPHNSTSVCYIFFSAQSLNSEKQSITLLSEYLWTRHKEGEQKAVKFFWITETRINRLVTYVPFSSQISVYLEDVCDDQFFIYHTLFEITMGCL